MQDPREKLVGHRGRFTRRALLLGGAQVGLFGVLGWRLYQLQVVESSKFSLLSDENRISAHLLAPRRGVITDRFGEPIATNTKSLLVSVVPEQAEDLEETLDRLAAFVPVTETARDRALRLARRQSAFVPIVIADNLTWRQFSQINLLAPSLPGVQTDVGWRRVYHHGYDMAHIIGYVGAGDKAEVNEDPMVRLPGFRVGKVGVEKGFDHELRGHAGVVKLEVNAYGRTIRKLDQTESEPGRDLVLTIDHQLQDIALKRLAEERRASVVALDAQTGDVLVMASTPSYDPNTIVGGLTEEDWRALMTAEDDPLTNKAIRGQYPPGSTFKVAVALAGLEAGVITPKTKIWCPGGYFYSGHYFGCWRKRGHRGVQLHKAIKESCDVFFYETARQLGINRLAAGARKLGLGQTYDCGLSLQKPGVIPDPKWKRATLSLPWYGGETIIAGIGQGFVLTTPLQLAVMTARIASGRQIVPRIVRPAPGEKEVLAPPLDIALEHLEVVRAGMVGVVNEGGGTAGRSRLPIPGVLMAGKTGTSQVSEASSGRKTHQLEWKDRDHALFIGYAPTDTPRYAVAAVVEHGGGGSAAAAPVVRDLMTELIQRDPLARPVYVAKPAPRRTAGGTTRGGES